MVIKRTRREEELDIFIGSKAGNHQCVSYVAENVTHQLTITAPRRS